LGSKNLIQFASDIQIFMCAYDGLAEIGIGVHIIVLAYNEKFYN
jgi:hypothetical protein